MHTSRVHMCVLVLQVTQQMINNVVGIPIQKSTLKPLCSPLHFFFKSSNYDSLLIIYNRVLNTFLRRTLLVLLVNDFY